ncbi:hypothetical protein LQV05_001020 [Cryptococcus neoformans]|nr:hypothetical protein J007_05313 [Cryptococcus neoformans var. grubii]OXC62777.1 hypothetical protein C358_01887 [Cryptococcus neoformans var. grubii MW-RSA852]UOH84226.1 hypothetical protein LQV05_001020 [Cryptococcus neoformans]
MSSLASLPSFLPQESSPQSLPPAASSCRISRLPPLPSIPHAGPPRSAQRYLYFGVRRGFSSGVYTDWQEAEKQIADHPEPALKTFSTRLAAEAYVSGWDGAGRHSLPPSTPRPLREHLAMSFPGSVNVQAPASQRRQSYHARLLASSPTEFGSLASDTSPSTLRPGAISRSSYRSSVVHISSPLRQQVDDDSDDNSGEESSTDAKLRSLRKAASYIGAGGLLSPPQSPEKKTKRLGDSVIERERPVQRRALTDSRTWSSRIHGEFPAQSGDRPLSPPTSPTGPTHTRRPSDYSKSCLWADSVPQQEPARPESPSQPDLADPTIPKFSRSGLRKSGVVMPVAAKHSSSSLSLKSRGSLFSSSNDSSSSITSLSSNGSDRTMRRLSHSRQPSSSSRLSQSQFSSQDRLATLAETSKQELQLNDEDHDAIPPLSPPRPAFMRRVSSASSIGSNDSFSSMGSMTSGSSAHTSSLESCEPITEEVEPDVHIQQSKDNESIPEHALIISGTCTKSDDDASVDSVSMKHIKFGKNKGGGVLKRLVKVLGLEKKSVEAARRGSM